jgi:Asp-tRNA(Asn)/Glu-tRNA(Gln) amidotransferase C subunit
MNTDKISKEAKKIMDNFVDALGSGNADGGFEVRRDLNMRSGEELILNSDFRERVLENAPKVKDGFIVAEKKKW